MSNLTQPVKLAAPAGKLILAAACAMILSACGTEDNTNQAASSATTPTTSSGTVVKLSKVTDIPQESADNYDDNVNGLITAATLKRWIDDWATNKPAGITGKLVILQAAASGTDGVQFIAPKAPNVAAYHATEWTQTRSNGVIMTERMVPDGDMMNSFLAKYDVDPTKDMIVCAPGQTGASPVMQSGRCWYMFRYWGVAKEHLAHLNGGNDWIAANTAMDSTYFTTTAAAAPGTGTAKITDLPEANMVLQATVEDMMNITPSLDTNLLNDGVFVWDARAVAEYDALGLDSNFRNQAIQGHPNGALELNFQNLLDTTAGYTFKSKAEIQAYMTGAADGLGQAFVDGSLQPVGVGRAYQEGDVVYSYCQTTYRAMITGFATAAILGLPTRFYDGAMVEWNSLNNVVDSSTSAPLPFDSPWRTDVVTVSNFDVHSDPTNPAAVARPVAPPLIVDAYAASANAVIDADLAFRGFITEAPSTSSTSSTTTTTTSTSSSGGSLLPANACGG